MKSQGKGWKLSLGSIRQWHWISSALCLAGMLLFAITGITLNHAGDIPANIQISTTETTVPNDVLSQLTETHQTGVPLKLIKWLADEKDLYISADSKTEWSDDELYVSLPRPGGDAWLSLDLLSGELTYEKTERGLISYVNDLHKGRVDPTVINNFVCTSLTLREKNEELITCLIIATSEFYEQRYFLASAIGYSCNRCR